MKNWRFRPISRVISKKVRCHSYSKWRIGSRVRSIEWCRLQWPSMTRNLDFTLTSKYHDILKSSNPKMVQGKAIFTMAVFFWRTNIKYMWSIDRRHFQWPWTTPNPKFKVTPILDVEYGINGPYLGLQWITNKNLHTLYSSVYFEWPWTTLSDLQNF